VAQLGIELGKVNQARLVNVHVVEHRIQRLGRSLKANGLDGSPEFLLVDHPGGVGVELFEQVHHAGVRAIERVAQRVPHVLLVLDFARAVHIILVEHRIAYRRLNIITESLDRPPELPLVDQPVLVDVPLFEEVVHLRERAREPVLEPILLGDEHSARRLGVVLFLLLVDHLDLPLELRTERAIVDHPAH
jgi:hypothetical protein